MSDYTAFVTRKLSTVSPSGFVAQNLPPSLFPHQSALTAWALRRGRAAIFADTGLGKMRMELVWADAVNKHTGRPVMIHTPLAVAHQIAAEGARIGIEARVCRDGGDVWEGINVINYDRLHKINPRDFAGVVLDESGCIKHAETSAFKLLTEAYRDTPFKLPATATPAPNDWTELGTHAEFLGICTKAEMLAEFFMHDGGDTSAWRLKGHARSAFWRWVSSWGAMIRKPSDLGFDDGAYNLPPLTLHEHLVGVEMPLNGALFAMEAQTLSERREARRLSLEDRVGACASVVFGAKDGMETRVRGEPKDEVSSRPGVQGEAEQAIHKRSDSAQRVHGGVLQKEPGKVRTQDARTEGCIQRRPAEEVRGERCISGVSQGNSSPVGQREPGEEESPESSQVRDDSCRGGSDAGVAGECLRNMQSHRAQGEDVPNDRPLPQDGGGSRDSLLALQHGDWTHEGQPGPSEESHRLPIEPWLIWCDLNREQDELERVFGSLAFSVRGSDSVEEKESAIRGWLAGERPIMISKPSILGWGLNFQHCRNMAFVGVTDSYEAYYQAVRRCWRFGQARDVHVHIFASKAEGAIVANLKRKEREAAEMAASLSVETRDAVMAEVRGLTRQTNDYNASRRVAVPSFLKDAA